jgi:PAS domain S-box-containing protein
MNADDAFAPDGDLRFRAMADAAPVLIWETDESGLIFVNRHYLDFFGVDFDTVRAMGWVQFLHPIDAQGYEAAYREAFNRREPCTYECRFRRADGEYRWLRNSSRPVDGNRFVGCSVDVTDLKEAHFALRSSERHLKQILDTAATGLTRCSRDLRYLSANQSYAEITGIAVDEIIGRPIEEVVGHGALETIRPYIDRVLRGETVEYESEMHYRKGVQRHVHVVYTPWKEPDGSVSGWVASVNDVSDRKRAEIAHRTSEERYRLLLDAAAVGTWDEDLRTGQSIWNAQAFRIFGRVPQSGPVTSEAWSTRVYPDDQARVNEAYQRAFADGSLYECEHRIVRLDGLVRWIAPYGRFLFDSSGRPRRFVGVFRDVTEQKQTLEAQARLAAIADSSDDVILSETLDGIITSWNHSASRLFGYTAEEIIGRPINTLVPIDRQQEKRAMLERAARGESTISLETVQVRKDGTRVSVSVTMSPVRDAQNQIVGVSTIAHDLTEREFAQAALRASQERHRALIEAIPQLVWSCDSEGRCDFVSPQWLEYTGLTLPQSLDLGWTVALHPSDLEPLFTHWREAVGRSSHFDAEVRMRAADGGYRWFKLRAVPIPDTSGPPKQWFGTSTDITELVAARETQRKLADQRMVELAHMNRRANLGELTASLAHELNQPLTAILHNAEAAWQLLDSRSPDIRELQQILSDIKSDDLRASAVIKHLRSLLAPTHVETTEFDLKEVVDEVCGLLYSEGIEHGIALRTSSTHETLRVRGDRIQIQQVILNLVMNGIEAIGGGRRGQTIIARTSVSDGFAEVCIEDSGPGLPIGKENSLFEPFFTTKEGGMGMGLSIARTIIESHGGQIGAENRSAGGAAFRFRLPLVNTNSGLSGNGVQTIAPPLNQPSGSSDARAE